jgi:hypothetical protein
MAVKMLMLAFSVVMLVQISTFLRNLLLLSSGLKVETLCFSEMLVSAYKSTWRYNPEDQRRQE